MSDALIDDVVNEILNNVLLTVDFFEVPIEVRERTNIFFHGPGGTGKTYAIRTLVQKLEAKGIHTVASALTGIAALGLSSAVTGELNQGKKIVVQEDGPKTANIRGCTLHSFAFGRAWAQDQGYREKPSAEKIATLVRQYRTMLERWQQTHVLIVDEVSMMGCELLELVDKVGRLVRDNRYIPHNNPGAPFGGLTLVFSGDLLQLPPVKENFVFTSPVFYELNFRYYLFETPQRFVKDVKWFYILQRVRKGRITSDDIRILGERYDAWTKLSNKDILTVKPTLLYATNVDVDAHNKREMDALPGEIVNFVAIDSWERRKPEASRDAYEKETDLNIPSFIQLKVGAQVMLKVNLSVDEGKVNGSRGVVVGFIKTGQDLPQVKVKWYLGDETIVSPYVFTKEDKGGCFSRIQIPLKPAWSTTIHKSQGVSLDCVVASLGKSIFLGGMAYVVLSRVRSIEGLFLSEFDPKRIYADAKALEFVERIENSEDVDYIYPPAFIKIPK